MTMKRTALTILLLASSFPARAGLMAEFASKHPGDTVPEIGRLRVEPDRMRLDSPDGGMIIFRGDKQILWIVKAADKSYTEITKAQAQALSDQVAAMKVQLQVQLSTMPPEQRAMIEQALNQGTAGQTPRSYVKTGKTARVNNYPCVQYNAMRGDTKESEVWVTDWKNLGATLDDFKVMREIASFMNLLAGAKAKDMMPGFMDIGGQGKESIPGFPVKSIRTSAQGEASEELQKFVRQTNPKDSFEVPAGYVKREFGPAASKPQ
jgi:hypothetical protein